MSAKDYKTKVKAAVQEQDVKKVEDLKAERETLVEMIKKFEGLRA